MVALPFGNKVIPDQVVVARGGAGGGVAEDGADEGAGDVAGDLGVEAGPGGEGDTEEEGEGMDSDTGCDGILPRNGEEMSRAATEDYMDFSGTSTRYSECEGGDRRAGRVDMEDPCELWGAVGVYGPVVDAREAVVNAELSEVALRLEDVRREQLATVGEPVHEQIVDGVGVDALLRPHVAGFEEHAPPNVLYPLSHRVMHLILRLHRLFRH